MPVNHDVIAERPAQADYLIFQVNAKLPVFVYPLNRCSQERVPAFSNSCFAPKLTTTLERRSVAIPPSSNSDSDATEITRECLRWTCVGTPCRWDRCSPSLESHVSAKFPSNAPHGSEEGENRSHRPGAPRRVRLRHSRAIPAAAGMDLEGKWRLRRGQKGGVNSQAQQGTCSLLPATHKNPVLRPSWPHLKVRAQSSNLGWLFENGTP